MPHPVSYHEKPYLFLIYHYSLEVAIPTISPINGSIIRTSWFCFITNVSNWSKGWWSPKGLDWYYNIYLCNCESSIIFKKKKSVCKPAQPSILKMMRFSLNPFWFITLSAHLATSIIFVYTDHLLCFLISSCWSILLLWTLLEFYQEKNKEHKEAMTSRVSHRGLLQSVI